MKIVALTDLHGDTSCVDEVFAASGPADVVLLTGDLTHFGHSRDAIRLLHAIQPHAGRILAVLGNCDYPDVGHALVAHQADLHGRHVVLEGVAFLGVGKSLPCPGTTPGEISEAVFSETLEQASEGSHCDSQKPQAAYSEPDSGAPEILLYLNDSMSCSGLGRPFVGADPKESTADSG